VELAELGDDEQATTPAPERAEYHSKYCYWTLSGLWVRLSSDPPVKLAVIHIWSFQDINNRGHEI